MLRTKDWKIHLWKPFLDEHLNLFVGALLLVKVVGWKGQYSKPSILVFVLELC